jgi:hypothetical protein
LFKFEKRRQLLVGGNDESLSVAAMRVCREKRATSRIIAAGSSGDFADSIPVFAAPKRIGLKSNIRLSGVLVRSSSITSPDVSTQLQPVSQLSRQNEVQNQMFHTWRKRSALDIVYYGLWSARQKSV